MTARIAIILGLVILLVLGPLTNVALSQKPEPLPFQIWFPVVISGIRENKMARVGIIHGGGTFESGNLADSDYYYEGDSNEPIVVSTGHPVRAGTYSMRCYIEDDQPDNHRRCEAVAADDVPGQDPFNFNYGTEYWLGLSIYIPSDWVTDQDGLTTILLNIQCIPDAGEPWKQPCLSLRINGDGSSSDNWQLIRRWQNANPDGGGPTDWQGTSQEYNASADVDKGQWTDWVFHLYFDSNPAGSGYLEVWKNGILIVDVDGPMGCNDVEGPQLQVGAYVWYYADGEYDPHSTFRLIYDDEIRVGDNTSSYNDVKPGEEGTTTSTSTLSTTSTSTLSSTSTVSTTSTTTTSLSPYGGKLIVDCVRGKQIIEFLSCEEIADRNATAIEAIARGY